MTCALLAACGPSADPAPTPTVTSAPTPTPTSTPDPLRDQQWALDVLDPQETAWPVTTGEGVTVAVVDSGVMADHPDLAGRVDPGIDLVEPGTPPDDVYGHGTHVAGIIAATAGNGEGIAGLAPGVRILPVRVLDDDGDGSYARTAAGIRWAADHGAQVINLSLTLAQDDARVRDAVAYAVDHNVVVVAAAGNRRCPKTGANDTTYPAAYDGVVGVGASDQSGAVTSFSSCGPWVDLVAPGIAILSLVPPDVRKSECKDRTDGCLLTGTSEAAPFVTAAAALRVAQLGADRYRARDLEADLVASADDIAPTGHDDRSGGGLLDLAALLAR